MPSLPYIQRATSIKKILDKKSVLLVGPRRTGKSSFIRNELKPDRVYNLLNSVTFRDLAMRPSLIREHLESNDKVIVIDEIQRLPNLMDEVHLMIEELGIRFLLTGSSVRKIRRSYTSLMAGRARKSQLFPLTAGELGKKFELSKALLYGTLPSIYLSDDPWDDLKGYVGEYLKEEIMAEALARNVENFARFLQTAAATNGEILNFEKIGMDAQVPARTIREYYAILEDTLIGNMVQPFKIKKSRKYVSKSKFYFFDLGVVNSLLERKSISPKTSEFGNLFEMWVYLELKAYKEYKNRDEPICFWRTQSGEEVDFIIGDSVAIEVKSSTMVTERHTKGLEAFEESLASSIRKIIVSMDSSYRKIDEIEIFPYTLFVSKLWSGEIF